MPRLGAGEILVIVAVVLLLFGPSKLPALGKSLAEFFKNFKGGLKEVKEEAKSIEKELS